MSTEITKIGFEKCLGQLTKSKDKVLDTLKRDEQNLADARKTLQKAKNENDRRCKERIQNSFYKLFSPDGLVQTVDFRVRAPEDGVQTVNFRE